MSHYTLTVALPGDIEPSYLRQALASMIRRAQTFGGPALNAENLADEIVEAIQPQITAKRAMDLSGYAIHHLNGNPHDHSPENLRLVKIRDRK